MTRIRSGSMLMRLLVQSFKPLDEVIDRSPLFEEKRELLISGRVRQRGDKRLEKIEDLRRKVIERPMHLQHEQRRPSHTPPHNLRAQLVDDDPLRLVRLCRTGRI